MKSDLRKVSLKIFNEPKEFNFTKREMVTKAMSENGIGATHYEWYYEWNKRSGSKDPVPKLAVSFDELLIGRELLVDELALKSVMLEVAEQMGRMHSISYADIPTEHNFKYEYGLNWNTEKVYDFLYNGYKSERWFEAKQSLAERFGMTLSELETEFHACASLVQQTTSPVVFCHNDVHERNIINVTKDQTLKIIDFDLSSWGYRAYDLCYFFVHMPKWPSWTSIDLFLDAYLDIYNSLADIESGKDMLIQEIQYHMPFVLLGKMLLDESINQSVKASHIDAYFTAMSKNHNQLILHFT